jgi:hypothetical protein
MMTVKATIVINGEVVHRDARFREMPRAGEIVATRVLWKTARGAGDARVLEVYHYARGVVGPGGKPETRLVCERLP